MKLGKLLRDDNYPIYVISLAENSARKTEIAEQLHRLSLDFEFFDAVDGRNGLTPELEALIDRKIAAERVGRPMSDREIACALSHIFARKQALDRGHDGVIILEDDAILTDDFARFVNEKHYLKIPHLLLFHSNARIWNHHTIQLFDNHLAYRLALPAFGCVAYSISNQAISKLHADAIPVISPADWSHFHESVSSYACHKQIIHHPEVRKNQSLIEVDRPKKSKTSMTKFFTLNYLKRKYIKIFATKIS